MYVGYRKYRKAESFMSKLYQISLREQSTKNKIKHKYMIATLHNV